jgi:hypothetical protein
MEGAGNIYTAERAIDSTQVPKNWHGYHGTDQLVPSIDACVIMSSVVAKAHTKEMHRVLLKQGLRIAETRLLQLHMGYVCCVWK